MLRVSAKTTGTSINLQGVVGNADGAAIGIQHGELLMRFAESIARRDEPQVTEYRQAILDAAGAEVLVDAAGVAANFQRMVRIADSIGIPVDDMNSELGQSVREELGITRFRSAGNTLGH